MDQYIESAIASRRNALLDYYNLPADAQAKAEELFCRMKELGANCRDSAEFETALSASPLNNEYAALFTEFAPYVKTPEGVPTEKEQAKSMAGGQARSVVKRQTRNRLKGAILNALPDSVSRWLISGIYNVPILGDIASAINQSHQLQRFAGRDKQKNAVKSEQNKKEETGPDTTNINTNHSNTEEQ